MSEKLMLKGVSSEDYIHPLEQKMRLTSDMKLVSKGLDVLNDLSVSLIRRITLGKHIEVNRTTAPDLDALVRDVCDILDYPQVPRVYICHQAAQTLFCAGSEHVQITFSDYIWEQFDMDMLYFAFGNIISMLKAGHVRLATICSMMIPSTAAAVLEMPLRAYLRAADMSSDRGGLLACQNFSAAAKCILWDAGIPLSEMKNDGDIIRLSRAYINAVDYLEPDWLTQLSSTWKKLNMDSMPHAYRLRELLEWYENGYPALIARWS